MNFSFTKFTFIHTSEEPFMRHVELLSVAREAWPQSDLIHAAHLRHGDVTASRLMRVEGQVAVDTPGEGGASRDGPGGRGVEGRVGPEGILSVDHDVVGGAGLRSGSKRDSLRDSK